jgi:hypothetical protein
MQINIEEDAIRPEEQMWRTGGKFRVFGPIPHRLT